MANVYDLNPEFDASEANPAAEADLMDAELPFDTTLLQDVKVSAERLDGRQRKISAVVTLPQTVEQVWQVITDYDHLADFIPNLAKSHRIEHPHNGIRLEQIGSQCFLNFKFCARVVLDMVEQFPHQLSFQMVEGDFKAFSGSWDLQTIPVGTQDGTNLRYTVLVTPRIVMPVGLIERRLKTNLAVNLIAIRQRAELLFR